MEIIDLFVTETMAELSARQGRIAEAVAIYRQLLTGAVDPERRSRWSGRLQTLEDGAGPESPRPVLTETALSRDAPLSPLQAPPPLKLPLTIRHPVRSGQIIYAEGGDLLVLAPVNPGAQLLADGNIHVYGPLRGRAVAGVRGCLEAQIFCQRLEAELVGVDAVYALADDLPPNLVGTGARIWIEQGSCRFARL
jgi:septum site-determining protein MinC